VSVTYKNAPLVELVAEVRWDPPPLAAGAAPGVAGTPAGSHSSQMWHAFSGPKDEEVFVHFGALMSSAGYGRAERMIPPGIPVLAFQPAARYRPTDPDDQATLFQLGRSVFSANALPPYKSWQDFGPVVAKGLGIVVDTYKKAALPPPEFHTALLRYIDAFRDDLTGGRTALPFLREVLGLNLALPEALVSLSSDPAHIQPLIRLMMPTAIGRLETTFADGLKGNERAVIWDTTVTIESSFGSDVKVVMKALTDARLVIHNLFRGLTAPIHAAMQPIS
jgi:uncharacterized protein (TIGR04255 family)